MLALFKNKVWASLERLIQDREINVVRVLNGDDSNSVSNAPFALDDIEIVLAHRTNWYSPTVSHNIFQQDQVHASSAVLGKLRDGRHVYLGLVHSSVPDSHDGGNTLARIVRVAEQLPHLLNYGITLQQLEGLRPGRRSSTNLLLCDPYVESAFQLVGEASESGVSRLLPDTVRLVGEVPATKFSRQMVSEVARHHSEFHESSACHVVRMLGALTDGRVFFLDTDRTRPDAHVRFMLAVTWDQLLAAMTEEQSAWFDLAKYRAAAVRSAENT